MTRRPVLPGASELFRRTEPLGDAEDFRGPSQATAARASVMPTVDLRLVPPPAPAVPAEVPISASTTGRTRHEEKITVYLSADELLAMEQARLTLRARHRITADRGLIVRTAVAVLLSDLESRGADSILVQRLLTA